MSGAAFLAAIGRMTVRGSIVILILLLARLLLKKAPKWTVCALWLIALFRLLCPVSVVSPVSVVPSLPIDNPAIVDKSLPPIYIELPGHPPLDPAAFSRVVPMSTRYQILSSVYLLLIWGLGVLALAVWGLVSYGKLRRALRAAVPVEGTENVWLADGIASPFTLGLFRPKIYLPSGLSEGETACILRHEKCHIRSLDTLWKLLGYLALCMHWFNPLVWLACALAGRDMELRCDEAVLRKLGEENRADYARSILSFAAGTRPMTVFPAFGDGDPKARIRNISRWKKPKFSTVAVSILVCLALCVCLLSDARAVSKADSILCLGFGNGRFSSVDYRLYLGNNVHSGELWLELWQDGQRLSAGGMTVSEKTENLHIELAMDGGSGLVHATIADDGATYETDVSLPMAPMSWAVGSCEENVRFAVQPGGEYILAALYYDVSAVARVHSLDCEALTQEPGRIREIKNVLIVRLTLSGEREPPLTASAAR